jgi:hypothetical protein
MLAAVQTKRVPGYRLNPVITLLVLWTYFLSEINEDHL